MVHVLNGQKDICHMQEIHVQQALVFSDYEKKFETYRKLT